MGSIFTFFLQLIGNQGESASTAMMIFSVLSLLIAVVSLIKRNVTSTYIYVFTQKRIAYVGMFFLLCLAPSDIMSQVMLDPYVGNDSYMVLKQKYEHEKASFPKFFFTYANYGANASDAPISPEVLNARLWLIDVPVVVRDFQDNAYSLWLCNLNYAFSGDTTPTKNTITLQKEATEEYALRKQEAMQLSAYERMEQFNAVTTEEKDAKELYLRTHNKEAEMKEQLIKREEFLANDKVPEVIIRNKYNDIPAYDAKSLKANKKLKRIAPQFSHIVDSLGVEGSLKWLFQQQVLAGNIIYGDSATGIPIPLKNYEKEMNEYVALLEVFVRDFGYSIGPLNSAEVKELKMNRAAFAEKFAGSVLKSNMDTSKQFKIASKLLNVKIEQQTTIITPSFIQTTTK